MIKREPLIETMLAVRLDGVDWALRLADPAVDALVGVDDEHVLALVEAVDRAHRDAIGGLALDALLIDDVSIVHSTLWADTFLPIKTVCRSRRCADLGDMRRDLRVPRARRVTSVAASILPSHVQNQRFRALRLDFEGGDERVFGVDDHMFGFAL